MKYQNPILLCDYSDPDVIRVGKTFYMTASSFNFVPGLPLLTSKNLVDWKLVGYAAKKIELPGYDQVQNAKGIWAPSLRFHNGIFYIFFATPDEGIFETHTSDFEGEWSHWNCVWHGKGFIDPCPIWLDGENDKNDENFGKIFVVHGYAKSRIGFNSKLGILELDENLKAKDCRVKPDNDTKGNLDNDDKNNSNNGNRFPEDKIIFDGTKTQPTIEGPKIYTRGEYFYIFAPAGGVTFGWQTVLRSKNIFGPYEEKIVLAQGKSKVNGPHQGGYVETESGEGFFLHFQDAGIYGRITHLQPVKWKNGWPLMGSATVENKSSLRAKRSNLIENANETGEPLESYFVPFDEDSEQSSRHSEQSSRHAELDSASTKEEIGEPLESYFVPFDEDSEQSSRHSEQLSRHAELADNRCRPRFVSASEKKDVSEFQFSGNAGIEKEDCRVKHGNDTNCKGENKKNCKDENEKNTVMFGLYPDIFGDGTLWLNPNVCTKKITSKKFEYEREILISDFDERFRQNQPPQNIRHGIIFLGNEYSALQVEKRSDGFYLSQIVSSGSEKGDDVRQENLAFEEKLAQNVKSVLLKLNFEEDEQNARFGKITFSCKTSGENGEIDFVSEPFRTENAHWVGGRFGFF